MKILILVPIEVLIVHLLQYPLMELFRDWFHSETNVVEYLKLVVHWQSSLEMFLELYILGRRLYMTEDMDLEFRLNMVRVCRRAVH